MNGILSRVAPGIDGFLAAEQMGQQRQNQQLAQMQGILAVQNAMETADVNRQLKPLQIQQLQSQIADAERKRSFDRLLEERLKGSNVTPVARDANGGILDGRISTPGAANNQIAALLTDPSFVMMAKMRGYDFGDLFKHYSSPQEMKPGSTYQSRVDGTKETIPKLPEMTQFQGGRVSLIPGAAEVTAGLEGAKQGAQAQFDTVTIPMPDGSTRMIPKSQIQQFLGGAQPAPQPAVAPPAPQPAQPAPRPSWAEGRSQAEIDAINRVASADARGEPLSVTVPPQPTVQPIPTNRVVGVSQTPEQSEAAKVSGKSVGELVSGYRTKIPSLNGTLRRLDRLEELTGNDQTFAGAGAEIKSQLSSIGQALGLPIQINKTANTEEYIAHVAELLKERLASKDYGSGTGVSNVDLLAAGRPLPEVMRTPQGRIQIIAAIRKDAENSIRDMSAARDYFEKNMSLNGFRYPSEIDAQIRREQPGAAPMQNPPQAPTRTREQIFQQYGIKR